MRSSKRQILHFTSANASHARSQYILAPYNTFLRVNFYYVLSQDFHGARQDVLLAVHIEPSHPEISALLQRFFHGKSAKDVLASQAASGARKQLLQIAGPTLRPLTQQRPLSGYSGTQESEKSDSVMLLPSVASRENTMEPLPPITGLLLTC